MRIVYALLLAMSLVPISASAQHCPGANGATGASAYVYGSGGTTGTAFIGASCATASPVGTAAPTDCVASAGGSFWSFMAEWPSIAARSAAGTMDGCRFVCNGGANTCFVDGVDGLPVELMEFSVGE